MHKSIITALCTVRLPRGIRRAAAGLLARGGAYTWIVIVCCVLVRTGHMGTRAIDRSWPRGRTGRHAHIESRERKDQGGALAPSHQHDSRQSSAPRATPLCNVPPLVLERLSPRNRLHTITGATRSRTIQRSPHTVDSAVSRCLRVSAAFPRSGTTEALLYAPHYVR